MKEATRQPKTVVDLALARRLEAADASANVDYVAAHAHLRPDVRAVWTEVAGGCLSYAGADSPLTQAVGLGLAGVFDARACDELEEFFGSRGAEANVHICPLADASVCQMLAARGYRLGEFIDKLFLPLDPSESFEAQASEILIRTTTPAESELWTETVGRGFYEGEEPPNIFRELFRTLPEMLTTVCFLAEIDGRAVGAGLLKLDAGTAVLSTTSVLPAWRGRGVQTALLQARLAYAAAQGCDLATVAARPASISHRNVQSVGFRVAYTRLRLFRPLT
ncbi:MAG TPA: GNAT family N-acetyltransferase [Pyrinomonadaceae bacterium]|nr:GNAT family N-acetyltransferase [Pyrinomonadaceae bacterium]